MEEMQPRTDLDKAGKTGTRGLRRILMAAGLLLVVLILVAVAIYAGAFIMLAPMMQ